MIHRWRRLLNPTYPDNLKIGISTTKPNEVWHVDISMIRLLDGFKLYLSGMIDNHSRRIVEWNLEKTFNASIKAELLTNAATNPKELTTSITATKSILRVMMDNRIENFN